MDNIITYLTPKNNTLYLESDVTIRQALEKFDVHKFSVVPRVDEDGLFVSTISEGDILRYIKNNCNFNLSLAESIRVGSLEKYRPYIALSISTPIDEIVRLSLEIKYKLP